MNIKETIEKLQSLDIEDVKNINFSGLGVYLKQSPIIIVNVILIGATAFFVLSYISKAKLDEKKYSQSAAAYTKKLAAVTEQKKIKAQYDEFITNFPKPISGNLLIDKFSELAINRNIQILSFSSAKESSNDYLQLTTVNLSIESSNYKNIILFIKDIEEYPFAVRLERFTANLNSTQQKNNNSKEKKEKNNMIRADIQVSSLKVK